MCLVLLYVSCYLDFCCYPGEACLLVKENGGGVELGERELHRAERENHGLDVICKRKIYQQTNKQLGGLAASLGCCLLLLVPV